MKHKHRALMSVVGVLLVIAAIGFVITGEEPLYGQGQSNRVPDLRGVWRVDLTFYNFLNVTHPQGGLEFVQLPPGEEVVITDQTGGVFAGNWNGGVNKLTGVILPDGTVSIQTFELTELRMFFTGSIDRKGGRTLKVSGFFHGFDDFGAEVPADRHMLSGLFEIVKVN